MTSNLARARSFALLLVGAAAFAACDDEGTDSSIGGGGATSSSKASTSTNQSSSASGVASSTASGTTASGTAASSSASTTSASSSSSGGGMVDQDIALYGDFDTDSTHEVATVTFPGPSTQVLSLMGFAGGEDITAIAYSPDGTKLAVAGRDTASSMAEIHVYDATTPGTPNVLATATAADREITSIGWSPDGAWIAFLHDGVVAGGFALYVVPTDGTTSPKIVSGQPSAGNRDITSFAWSPIVSGTERYLAYSGDLVANDDFGLWSVEITASTPTPVEIVTDAELGTGEDVQATLGFDETGRVYFKSDFEVDNLFRLYRAQISGAGREQVPGTALMNGVGEASIGTFGLDASGKTLAFSAEAPTAAIYDVYTLPVAMTVAAKVSNVSAMAPAANTSSGPNFNVPIVWSKDGARLGVVADYILAAGEADNAYAAWVFPTTGMGGVRVLGAPTSAMGNQDIDSVAFSTDGLRLFAIGDMRVEGDNELFSTVDLATANQDPSVIVLEPVPAGGDIDGVAPRP